MKSKACEYEVRNGTTGYNMYGVLRCASMATEGSRFCAVHLRAWGSQKETPTPRVKRDLDLDVLPWTDQDVSNLGAAAYVAPGRRRRA